MTSFTSSSMIVSALGRQGAPDPRAGLRRLFARMVAAAQADTARRHIHGMPDYLLRDIGLGRGDIDVIDL